MKEDHMVSRQMAFLVFLCMLGTAFIFVPESITGRDSWLSTLAGSFTGLAILYLIITLHKMHPGMSILQISKKNLGKTTGTFFNIIYLGALLFVVILTLYDFTFFLVILFSQVSPLVIKSLILLVIIHLNYRGFQVLGRMTDLLAPSTFLLALLVLLIPLADIDWSNFLPMFRDWRPILAGTMITSNWPFGEIIFLALLFHLVSDLNQNSRKIYYWYGVAAFFVFLRTVIVIGMIGPETAVFYRLPFFQVVRHIFLEGFERIELFFFYLWFLIEGAVLNAFFASLCLGLKEMLNFRKQSTLMIPVGLLAIVLCDYMFPSDIGMLDIEGITAAFITLPVYILYPTVIFIAARIRAGSSANSPRSADLNDS